MSRKRIHFFPSLALSVIVLLPIVVAAVITVVWSFAFYSSIITIKSGLQTDSVFVEFFKIAYYNIVSNPSLFLFWAILFFISAFFLFLFSGAGTDDLHAFLLHLKVILFRGILRLVWFTVLTSLVPGVLIVQLHDHAGVPWIDPVYDFLERYPYIFLFIAFGFISPMITALRTQTDLIDEKHIKERRSRYPSTDNSYYDSNDYSDKNKESSFGSSPIMFSGGGGSFISDLNGNDYIKQSDGSLYNLRTNTYMPKASDGRIYDLSTGKTWENHGNGTYISSSGKMTKVFGSEDDD